MFSGIIEATGKVEALARGAANATLTVATSFPASDLVLGESIATNGVCLTVRTVIERGFTADVSPETLARTSLATLVAGDVVNLERSLRVGDRISGHFVFGHVDGVGRVEAIEADGDARRFRFRAPDTLAAFIVDKGSVAVDGISLTMCDCAEASFWVAIIPHTFENTNLARRRVGDHVNLEADMLARYVHRALASGVAVQPDTTTGAPLEK